jgi:hypothetical protein
MLTSISLASAVIAQAQLVVPGAHGAKWQTGVPVRGMFSAVLARNDGTF